MQNILVTRPLNNNSKTASKLKNLGFNPIFAPVLTIEQNDSGIIEFIKFLKTKNYNQNIILIITSINAIKFIDKKYLHNLKAFIVGENTAKFCKEIGIEILQIFKDAMTLKNFIQNQKLNNKFIYLSSDFISVDFDNLATRFITYEAQINKELDLSKINFDQIDAILFYSKRSLEVFLANLQQHKLQLNKLLQQTSIFCLSKDIANIIIDTKNIYYSSEKTEDNLLDILRQKLIKK